MKAIQKQNLILNNTIINPDGFGAWAIHNYGTNPLIINDTIVLQSGEKYAVDLDWNVIFQTSINIRFDNSNNGTSRAALIKIYIEE